ncbi:uncharacterized protein LOC123677547 isoform X2 [Harmonia axyridis]|uniref:uncharacterized protein LOC123677547 isoform X2 n=1 Tax=Harmonia axyridis TaxID=115357 RepID=UPI001E279D0B|nr:uncharacterized protein LOC123677547 isoform X2 [Harmonia axyridis]
MKFLKAGSEELIKVAEKGAECVEQGVDAVGDGVKAVGDGVKAVGDGVKAVGEATINCVTLLDDGVENILKLKRICQTIFEWVTTFKSYLESDNVIESTTTLAVWFLLCYYFQMWMIPAIIIIIYAKKLFCFYVFGAPVQEDSTSNKSTKNKVEAIDEIISLVRVTLCNLEWILQYTFLVIDFNPISWSVIFTQISIALILMLIPFNIILMLLGLALYLRNTLQELLPKKCA